MNTKTGVFHGPVSGPTLLLWVGVAALAFHAAYVVDWLGFLVVVYLFGLIQLARAATWRKAFYPGLLVGLLIAAARLDFFWRIFSGGALGLWLVYAFWIGLFVALARLALQRLPTPWNWATLPFLWCGLEYFRSELYYLRFSWLNPGFAFPGEHWALPLSLFGGYGIGFLLAGFAAAAAGLLQANHRLAGAACLLAGAGFMPGMGWAGGSLFTSERPSPQAGADSVLRVAGVQMEFPTEAEVLIRLKEVERQHPQAELIVLSEYTFDGPVPDKVRNWCRETGRYLIAGGKEPAGDNFENTAYVVSPAGEVVFQQVKRVPIQFFKDGLPAREQKLWESPWGRIGICICYDLSYTRVTDPLVKLGAQALIVPTMDVIDWGERQHILHGRVTPLRAAEYGVPIFRVASSGISQSVDPAGRVRATASCPGEGALLAGDLEIGPPGQLPLDRWGAPLSTGVTLLLAAALWVYPRLRQAVPQRESRDAGQCPPADRVNHPTADGWPGGPGQASRPAEAFPSRKI